MDDPIRPKPVPSYRLRPVRVATGALGWVLEVNGSGAPVAWGWSTRECLEIARQVGRLIPPTAARNA